MAEDKDALAPGTMVGAYRIEHRLGSGGMGTVYAAEEPTIKKRVAIKVLRRSLVGDPSIALRFEREARAANDVRHPAIVDVFALGKLPDERPYLVMSLLEGRSLAAELEARGKLAPREAWGIVREVAEALAAAHAAGIVHRDLKPDNVFLERFGDKPARPRLLDLGIAKLLARPEDGDLPAERAKLTETGVPIGTPGYMAPEQWWGTEVDARTDQYALGITLFELLTGGRPFKAERMMELGQLHLNAAPPSLASAGLEVPAAVEALLARALAKAPEERFATMSELVSAGDAAFDVLVDASAATVAAPRAESPRASPAAAAPAEAPPSPSGISPRFLVAHAILVVLGPLALLAVGYVGEERRDVGYWLHDGGPLLLVVLASYIGGAVSVAWALRRRERDGRSSFLPWAFAVTTAAVGLLGTYLGWRKSVDAIDLLQAPQRFEILHEGLFEIQVSRFLSFFLASLLFISIASAAGAAGAPRLSETLVVSLGARRRESVAAALALVLMGAIGAGSGLPSVALVALVGAFVLGLDVALPALRATTARRDELERALAGTVAMLLTLAVALARVEGRQAVLWHAQATRAARATEIIAAAGEQSATLVLGLASVALVVLIELLRARRLAARGALRPTPAALAIGAVVLLVAGLDLALHRDFASARARLHDDLKPQFALFARLDPPGGGALDPASHAPHRAPALQIARNAVAVNADWKAPLTAIGERDGLDNLTRDLAHALAEHAALASEDAVDLAVSIDREVPWPTVLELLRVARRAGARRLELLLTHGPPLILPDRAPAEASWVLARDFIALPVTLAEDGYRASGDPSFGVVAEELVRRSLGGEALRIALP